MITISVAAAESVRANPPVEQDGTIHVPGFDLPESSFLSVESRTVLHEARDAREKEAAQPRKCPSLFSAERSAIPAIRQCEAEAFYHSPAYQRLRERYAVTLIQETIGGVYTEVFMPKEGVAHKNRKRVLLNVHGGGFQGFSRTASHSESIPIASLGLIKVVSIDYRMAPEYIFPAASEDVVAVYRELLKSYKPANIGLYGCSAGANLTAQAIARFEKENIPLPGAIGMHCAGAAHVDGDGQDKWIRSDAAHLMAAVAGEKYRALAYYQGVDRKNPLASPGGYDEIMAKFPPSLLISGTRDFALSSVIATHRQLTRLGVDARLHIWEGMSHAFLYNSSLPESREAYAVIVDFFDSNLGGK